MSNTIDIRVTDKCAALVDPGQSGVCDNDYTVVFDFDEEWADYANKTARFTFNDSYRDVVFSGNSVEMAYISNAPHVDIGVYAGDLCTTTPARLRLKPSIRGFNGSPSPPTQDVYDQIMATLDDTYAQFEAEVAADAASAASAKTAAETAEANAETAQAATEAAKTSVEATAAAFDSNATAKTITFNNNAAAANATIDGKVAEVTADAATVAADKATVAADKAAALAAKTAAETAETNAEASQAAAETAEDNAAASATAAVTAAVSADYLSNTANALKRVKSGTVVRMDDVSPLNHNLGFKQYGQCVQDGTPTPAAPVAITGKTAGASVYGKNLFSGTIDSTQYAVTTVVNADGSITLMPRATTCYGQFKEHLKAGTYHISYETSGTPWINFIRLWSGPNAHAVIPSDVMSLKRRIFTLNEESDIWIGVYPNSQIGIPVLVSLQIETSSDFTAYTPYAGSVIQTITDFNGDPVTLYGIPVSGGGNVTISGQQYIADTVEGTTLTRKVGVITAYNGETITGNYVSITGELSTGATVYYILTTPTTETVTLAPATIAANTPTTTVTAEAYTDTTYNRDAIKVIEELTAAIVALGGNI